MDPFTQGVVGAKFAQSFCKDKKEIFTAGVIGWLSGMAADLDVLIRSSTDSLLYIQYHRHFTHSLVFVPFGALICAAAFFALVRKRLQFSRVYYYCLLGYATHALLDCCTSYGTSYLWPFSDRRIAWDLISIVDPLYSLPLFALVVLSIRRRSPKLARYAIVYGLAYMSLGLVQKERALSAGRSEAEKRGHAIERLEAKPSFANLLLWKVIYEANGKYYVDAVRLGFHPRYWPGESVEKLDIPRDLPWLNTDSRQAKDIERFRLFSTGFIAKDPYNPNRVVDVRYSMIPNEIRTLWGIELYPDDQNKHARFEFTRDASSERRRRFWEMLWN